MDRRDFIKLAGFTSLSMFVPWAGSSTARAEEPVWRGPYFLHMHASGGWDPTLLCDAKVTAGGTTPVYENRVVTAVTDLNGIMVPSQTQGGKFLLENNGTPAEDPTHFFQTVGKNVLVFNGVDTQTNNHDVGVQSLACGHNDIELPALAALFAGKVARERDIPMAFLASGAYNRTGDVVGVSRFPGDKIQFLADPFRASPNDEKPLISDVATRRILELRAERQAALERQATLPRNKRTLTAFRDAARGGAAVNLLKQVAANAPPPIDAFANDLPPDARTYLSSPAQANGTVPRFIDFGRPLETILQCFATGVSASATYAQGGFDTHANHDTTQQASLAVFLARIRYVLARAAQLGLADKLYVLVTSDFGRTPRYNTGNGKDHWNVTSAMVAGPGIRGGRAIGGTDEGHKSLRVVKTNVSQTVPDTDANGARIHASHIHRELRRVLQVDGAPFINDFPLPSQHTPLPLLA